MILGKNIDLRAVQISDAEFILSLRLDAELNKHLSHVDDDINKQRDWIIECSYKKDEWYFIVQDKTAKPVGTIRIYNIQGDTFCWGSWIIIPPARKYASFESAYLLYKFAFENLKFDKSEFDIRKENIITINFHKKFGATYVGESDIDIFMTYTKQTFEERNREYLDKINSIIV